MINFIEWIAKKNEAFGPYGREEIKPQLSSKKLKKIFDITVQNLRDTWRKLSYKDVLSDFEQLEKLLGKIKQYGDDFAINAAKEATQTLDKIAQAMVKKRRISTNIQQDSGSDALSMAEKIWRTYQGK